MSKFQYIIETLREKNGIEFGGPTELFSNPNYQMNIYPHIKLDGGNIIKNNYFQSTFSEKFLYGENFGKQYDVDCTNEEELMKIKKYDYIVTSHVIEHFANPIKTLKIWKKYVLENDGYVLSIIPDYKYCFDRKRPLTKLNHLIEDFYKDTKEDDITHIQEQEELHDWNFGGHPKFYELCKNNNATRVVHHHVFDIKLVEDLFDYCGFKKILSFKQDDLNIVNFSKLCN